VSLEAVRARIETACARSGRDPAGVRLVAVTKGHDAQEIERRLLSRGVLDLGENRVQEWRDKAAALPADVRWHFVGTLQRNKVKYLADGGVTWVHSLNSARLADAMEAQAERRDHRFRALIEVDVAREEAKKGVQEERLADLLAHCAPLARVEVVGLMALAPYVDDPEATRPVFRRLAQLAAEHGLRELSMGMSRDVEVAIEEGATFVRVGSALFEDEDGSATDTRAPAEGRPA
jgi:pyridoxal phosphate enzyme (YggS family)